MAAARDALQSPSQNWSRQPLGTQAHAGYRDLAHEQDVNGNDRTQSADIPPAGMPEGRPFTVAAEAGQPFHGYGHVSDLEPDAESLSYLGAEAYPDQTLYPERLLRLSDRVTELFGMSLIVPLRRSGLLRESVALVMQMDLII